MWCCELPGVVCCVVSFVVPSVVWLYLTRVCVVLRVVWCCVLCGFHALVFNGGLCCELRGVVSYVVLCVVL